MPFDDATSADLPEFARRIVAVVEQECGAALSAAQIQRLAAALFPLLEQAKLESLAEFAAGAGHEINNPVATIAGRAQLLLADETHPERRRALSVIGAQALRIRDMIGDTMLFARPPVPNWTAVPLEGLAAEAADGLHELLNQRGCQLRARIPPDYQWWGDRIQLGVLVSSLIRNAGEAAVEPGVSVTLQAVATTVDSTVGCLLSVHDTGPGISPQIREHLFDPFYSGRQAGRGLGFGLAKAWQIVQIHHGRIEVQSRPGETQFEIWLPSQRPR